MFRTALFLIISGLAATVAPGQATAGPSGGGDGFVCLSGIDWGTGCFTTSKARSLATKAGEDYVKWSACYDADGTKINRCADVWVRNSADDLIRHRVSDTSCGWAKTCYAGQFSPMRVYHDNDAVFDQHSYWLTTRQSVRIAGLRGWRKWLSHEYLVSHVQASSTSTAHLTVGWTVYKPNGDYLYGERQEWFESYGSEAEQACDDKFALYEKRNIARITTGAGLCSIPLPEFVEFQISLEPLGVGGSAKSRWDIDFCDDAKEASIASIEAIAEQNRQLCHDHPEWYGISSVTGDEIPVFTTVPDLAESNVAYQEDGTCTNFDDTITIEWDADNGDHCWREYHVICGNDGQGGCTCEWTPESEHVCVGS